MAIRLNAKGNENLQATSPTAMQEPSLSDIYASLEAIDRSSLKNVKIQLLRNITVHPIEPFLRYYAAHEGFDTELDHGNYDSILNDAGSVSGDIVIIFFSLETFSPNLALSFNSLTATQIDGEVQRVTAYLATVLQSIRGNSNAPVIITELLEPVLPALGAYDINLANGQLQTIRKLNRQLQELTAAQQSVYILPLNQIAASIGHNAFFDRKLWHLSHLPFSRKGLSGIAKYLAIFVRGLNGKSKKCLVLDCDNVLWGGILGEDGPNAIKIGQSFPGSSYYEFQQELLNLYNRGIILALCSKNNEKDVLDFIESHPDILIKEKHLSAYKINWQEKHTNILALSEELNIGLDSMVFIDDSQFELELVRQMLPQVTTLDFSCVKPSDFTHTLKSYSGFDSFSISAEDKERGGMYKAEAKRAQTQSAFANFDEYLESLGIEIQIAKASDAQVPRVSQLTQRTNQFNLTTRRYSESEIGSLGNSPQSAVYCLRVKDKFGDLGLVGIIIALEASEGIIVDTFLMSCRALGRKIEDIFLAEVIKNIAARRNKAIYAVYSPTSKNIQTAEYYEPFGPMVDMNTLPEGLRTRMSDYSGAVVYALDPDTADKIEKHNYKVEFDITSDTESL